MSEKREKWGSRLGVILAVAGSAVGLGNFLVFPGRVVSNGGGAFLIPYFIAFVLIGIPLAWMEWSMGRMGGRQGHGSGPGVLNAVVKKPYAKYLGSLGVIGPLLIFFLYVFLESWILGYVWYSLTGELSRQAAAGTVGSFFSSYVSMETTIFRMPAALVFFALTFLINFSIIYLGVRRGIEKTAKILMPVLVILGLGLVIKVLTIEGIGEGLGYLWNPDFSKLTDISVWFSATAQVFFTTSVGIGCILTYASYVKKDQDVALSSLTANATNEFIEVIIGATIVVPMAVVFLGQSGAEESVTGSIFSLGFITMPQLFNEIPGGIGWFLQLSWFLLLFIGGVTSSISILQPGISFIEDELSYGRKKSVLILGGITLFFTLLIIMGMHAGTGVADEIDLWGFQLSLLLFGTIEVILFSWVIGVKDGWKELLRGAEIKIPGIYRFIMQYITPVLLIGLLLLWAVLPNAKGHTGIDLILMNNFVAQIPAGAIAENWVLIETVEVPLIQAEILNSHFVIFMRTCFLILLAGINWIIYRTWKQREAA
ncbi:MAG: sodium-dependent transporter [Fibrobacterota bacterium]